MKFIDLIRFFHEILFGFHMGFRWFLNRWRQWACQVQQGSGEGSREGLGGFGAARSGSTGFWRRFQRLASQHASERFVNIKRCGCWGYKPSLYFDWVLQRLGPHSLLSRCCWRTRLILTLRGYSGNEIITGSENF